MEYFGSMWEKELQGCGTKEGKRRRIERKEESSGRIPGGSCVLKLICGVKIKTCRTIRRAIYFPFF